MTCEKKEYLLVFVRIPCSFLHLAARKVPWQQRRFSVRRETGKNFAKKTKTCKLILNIPCHNSITYSYIYGFKMNALVERNICESLKYIIYRYINSLHYEYLFPISDHQPG